jgi:hypothetical protein
LKAKSILHLDDCRADFYNRIDKSKKKNQQDENQKIPFIFDYKQKLFVCQLCYTTMEHHSQLNHHLCYTPIPELKVPIDEYNLFLFDVALFYLLIIEILFKCLSSPYCFSN